MQSSNALNCKFFLYFWALTSTIPLTFFCLFCLAPFALPQGSDRIGQVVGWAENGVHDPTCNTAFQILQFRAVIWQPNGTMQELPPLPGDSTSAATAINDLGQVVGISGDCGVAVGSVSARHASTNPIVSNYF